MTGLGFCPMGTSPLGLGAPSATAQRAAAAASATPLAPRLDPATGRLVPAHGTVALADGLEQRIVLALRTRFGSSVVSWLGNRLHTIDRITDNHEKRIDTAVRDALRHLTETRSIELLKVVSARFGTSGTHIYVTWRDPAHPQQAARTLEFA